MQESHTNIENIDWNQHNQVDERKEYKHPEADSVDEIGDNFIYDSSSNRESNC